MNAERLLTNFDKIASAPQAIPRLRRFILDLAVRGKLVQQNPNDGLASELLKHIAVEKARLVKARTIRKPRDLGGDDDIPTPFEIPTCWRWVRLDGVGAIIGGGTPSATDAENFSDPGEGIPWLTPADLGNFSGIFISHGARDLSEKGLSTSSATLMPAGTVLFCQQGSNRLRCNFGKFYFNQSRFQVNCAVHSRLFTIHCPCDEGICSRNRRKRTRNNVQGSLRQNCRWSSISTPTPRRTAPYCRPSR